jgi:DNA-binding transcriptional regulator GbsR (MarR family)
MSMEQRRVMGSLIALGHYYGVARSVGQMIAMLAEAQGMAAGAPITSGP